MTHTPGPWQVEQMPFGGPPGWEVSSCEDTYSQDELFVTVWGSGECAEADARLIASAPAMLEVLEWLLEEFDRRELDGNAVFCLADLEQVRTVIRKASGEE